MADNDRPAPLATPPRTSDGERARMNETIKTHKMRDCGLGPARPDPETGEIRAGPGDAGLDGRPKINAGSPGIKQNSNGRLAIGLGIGALIAALVLIIRALF